MTIFLVEEDLEYAVGGCTFHYARLVHSDMGKLRYLANIRGIFDQAMYDTACVAVALRGWENLAGKDGAIPYPLELPASAISDTEQQTIAQLTLLTPTLTRDERAQLHGAFFVVTHLPLDVMSVLVEKVKELEPDLLKKRFSETFNGGLSLPVLPQAEPSAVSIAGAMSEGALSLATVEA